MDSIQDGTLDGVAAEDVRENAEPAGYAEPSGSAEAAQALEGVGGPDFLQPHDAFFMSLPADYPGVEHMEPHLPVPDGTLIDDIFFNETLLDPHHMETMSGLVHDGVAQYRAYLLSGNQEVLGVAGTFIKSVAEGGYRSGGLPAEPPLLTGHTAFGNGPVSGHGFNPGINPDINLNGNFAQEYFSRPRQPQGDQLIFEPELPVSDGFAPGGFVADSGFQRDGSDLYIRDLAAPSYSPPFRKMALKTARTSPST